MPCSGHVFPLLCKGWAVYGNAAFDGSAFGKACKGAGELLWAEGKCSFAVSFMHRHDAAAAQRILCVSGVDSGAALGHTKKQEEGGSLFSGNRDRLYADQQWPFSSAACRYIGKPGNAYGSHQPACPGLCRSEGKPAKGGM